MIGKDKNIYKPFVPKTRRDLTYVIYSLADKYPVTEQGNKLLEEKAASLQDDSSVTETEIKKATEEAKYFVTNVGGKYDEKKSWTENIRNTFQTSSDYFIIAIKEYSGYLCKNGEKPECEVFVADIMEIR